MKNKIFIPIVSFWLLDLLFHYIGVGETNYYYLSKLVNVILFSLIWFFVFYRDSVIVKLIYSFIFGTWISFYYLVFSYSGFVQWLGIEARYSPPPFVIFGFTLSPILWWSFHSLVFYLGLEIADLKIFKKL